MRRTMAVEDGRRRLQIEPGTGLHVNGHITPVRFGSLDWSGSISSDSLPREIAPARSFGR
jgi:UDP-3-O-[3-hydroxymyristoyl] N-acetylglucosamine deacetylase